MNAHLVTIKPAASDEACRDNMIEAIKRALAMAEAGELSGLVMVTIKPDHSYETWKVGLMRRIQIVGYLAQAQHDLMAEST